MTIASKHLFAINSSPDLDKIQKALDESKDAKAVQEED